MKNIIKPDAIAMLIQHSKEDVELLEFIYGALKSFEEYHTAVIANQLFRWFIPAGALMENSIELNVLHLTDSVLLLTTP